MSRAAKKVIHVSAIGLTASALLLPQCLHLQHSGYQVGFVFTPEPGRRDELEKMGFIVHEQSISRRITPADLLSILRLAVYFRREKPAIVHTHTSKGGAVGRLAAWLAGVPVIIHTIHGFPFIEGQTWLKYHVYLWIEKALALITDYFLSQSREDVDTASRYRIKARHGYPVHISNGVDVKRFAPGLVNQDTMSQIRESLQLGKEPIITMVARLVFEKGYVEMVEALSEIKDINWTALFAGPDEEAGIEIRRMLELYGIKNRVRLLGFRNDVDSLLAITDVFVLPSYREGLPRTLIEAQAMGVASVTTNIRGCREVVRDGASGCLVEPRDASGLARALRRLLTDRELRNNMGIEARKIAENEFDEEMVFGRIIGIYDKALGIAGETE